MKSWLEKVIIIIEKKKSKNVSTVFINRKDAFAKCILTAVSSPSLAILHIFPHRIDSACSPMSTSEQDKCIVCPGSPVPSVQGIQGSCTHCQHSSQLREERLRMIFTQVYHWSQCIVQLHPAILTYLRIPGEVIFCCQDMLLGRTGKEWFSCFLQIHEAY